MAITSYEQKAADNETLRNGVVNPCIGSLQLQPYTMAQLFAALFALIISVFLYFFVGFEIAATSFIVLTVALLTWGGQDFELEKEKLTKTRDFYSETPPKGIGKDGLPRPTFKPQVYVERNGRRYYSIEHQFSQLRFYGSYEKNCSNAGFYYQNQGTSPNVYLVFGFKVAGFSPCMDHMDCMQSMKEIDRSFKNFPNLKLRFVLEIPADGSAQILQQKRLLERADQDALTVEIIKARGQWAVNKERAGEVVAPTLRVYARVKSALGQENFIPQDWKDRWAAQLSPQLTRFFGEEPQQELAIQAMDFAFESCCTTTMRTFNKGLKLRARPLTVHEMYQHDFSKLHNTPVDKCPQYIRVTNKGLFEHEDMEETADGRKPVVPHHILGELFKTEGIPSTPVFYRSDVWFPLKGKKNAEGNPAGRFGACIRLNQLEGYADIEGSHAIGHIQNTFRWLEGMSDVELITEVEAVNPLRKKQEIAKGITNRQKRSNVAISKQTIDTDSIDDVHDLIDAAQMFRAGGQTLSTCTLIWVYADTRDKLKLKTTEVISRIGIDNCILVQNSIEQYWCDSQPYTWDAMCVDPLRRTEYAIPQAVPLIPFTQPQALDNKGVGYIGKTISAQYFIDFCGKKNHTFISAKSGGGKSMEGLEILAQCIATNTPFMFLDSPPIADQSTGKVAPSTYTPAINLWQSLGVNCAYQDIKKQFFNILGRYGLGRNSFELDALVETHVETLQAAVIGDNPHHPLAEYVKNLLALSYKDFARTSMNAEKDPILEDYLRHYMAWSNNYLNGNVDLTSIIGVEGLGQFEASDQEREAAAMIRSQLTGVLGQPWGKRINAQTDFDPNVQFLVLGLTDVKAGSKEGLVYALASLAFMNRMTSTHDHSVFGMDEGSTLLPMDAFASKFSRIFPEGRKKGGNGILITTELTSLFNSPYCGPILDNFDNILVGLSENTSVRKFVDLLGFKEEILRKYTQKPNRADMSSQWYLKRGDQHLELLYYTTQLLLALGATHPDELKAKRHFVGNGTPEQQIQDYLRFGNALYSAYSQGRGPLSLIHR